MIKKTIAITMTILFILPAICLAQDVEVGEFRFRWKERSEATRTLLTQIPITNRTYTHCRIKGEFLFYDKDGFELYKDVFSGELKAGESKILHPKAWLSKEEYAETTTFKVRIEVASFLWAIHGKGPFKIEKTLTLPPWD